MGNAKDSRPVYSTEQGRLCPECRRPVESCACSAARPAKAPAGPGVRIQRQTKGRKGKGVCLVTGLPLDQAGLESLAKKLKQRLGTGGSVKDGVIEIQGDHREALLQELKALGHTAKLSGG
ncbi:hypothetical protein NNJEOMEG_02928 [Fundidesulfovibrio magnetotacticus]|uniref:SUI1 domain-containing protein n=1 Tax=Fundidesulfovibrio magnetotacticus TaxID=2730080 RepID=A0A6V8M3N0_9BACT|nr:translation initiation factor Sui1 [Fundidesulfovibrio magnetotacticus]GFK95075.1 hypothetical protein NNJEOMEG_02928 [Fundidesulfovibrio magnetotacticus]